MKKIALIVAGLMASGASLAATTTQELSGGAKNPYAMTTCTLLANDIDIVLSANVTGTVACNDTTAQVGISVCHTKGLTASRSAVVTTNTAGAVICTVVQGGEQCVNTVTGALYPSVSTENGTVKQVFPGTACTTAGTGTQATSFAAIQ